METKFNIGDRVKVVKIDKDDSPALLNKVGKIVVLREGKELPYEVEFDEYAEEILWQEHELDFEEIKLNKFTRVYPECDDWEAWYMNGKLLAEGHKVRVMDILDALADIFPNTYDFIEISDERAEQGFSENLEDMINS